MNAYSAEDEKDTACMLFGLQTCQREDTNHLRWRFLIVTNVEASFHLAEGAVDFVSIPMVSFT
jgi:hypothetical protein